MKPIGMCIVWKDLLNVFYMQTMYNGSWDRSNPIFETLIVIAIFAVFNYEIANLMFVFFFEILHLNETSTNTFVS